MAIYMDPLVYISKFSNKFVYKHSLKALGALQIFSTKLTVHKVATAKQLSKNPQFLAHSSFSTVHSSQPLFQNPQLNQTHPK
jgi:hypothetical protein